MLQKEASDFADFIEVNRFNQERNRDVSHKALSETWSDHRHVFISYCVTLKGVARAVRLMKSLDRHVSGPSARYAWRIERRRRYVPMRPARAGYMLLPHVRLSAQDRAEIILAEMAEGRAVWTDMPTLLDGTHATVKACKEWAGIIVHDRLVILENYPLHDLASINTRGPAPEASAITGL